MTTGVDDEVTAAAAATYTIEQLARRVGMSPRNVRAHQARRLLAPPVRRGRVAWYDESHVRRLERIQALQRQGMSESDISAAVAAAASQTPMSQAMAGFLGTFVTGVVASAIIAIWIRARRPV